MKKLNTTIGGHPLITDNLDQLMGGVFNTFEALGRGIDYNSLNGFKLHGCDLTTLNTTDAVWTSGYIYLGGEICKVDAGSLTKAVNHNFKWRKYTETLPIDPQSYENGNSVDVHVEVKAKIFADLPFVFGVDITPNCETLLDILAPSFETNAHSVNHFRAEDAISGNVPWAITTRQVSHKLVNKTLTVNFEVAGTLASAAETLFIKLPDSLVADGRFYSVFWVADEISKATTFAAENEIHITKPSSSWTGLINVFGQIVLRVE